MVQSKSTPTVHIYPFSKLVNAPAAGWEKLIDQIEEGKNKAFAYYLPMREAVVLFCLKSGEDFDKVLGQLVRRAHEMGGVRGKKIAADNKAAFRMFVEEFYPRIAKFKKNSLHDVQVGVEFEGIMLTGAPHFIAEDQDGNTRFIFLHAAKWSDEQVKIYLQLLSVIIEKKYGGAAEQIWCMSLKNGKTIKFKGSARVLSRCADAAKHYARLAQLLTSD